MAQVFDGGAVKGEGDQSRTLQQGNQDGKDQTGNHRGGNGEFAQGGGVSHNGPSQEDDNGCEA